MVDQETKLSKQRGFNAVVGNPPWVLYVGKGSRPIDAREKAFLEEQFGRAAKPLSTHGLFATLAGRICQPRSRVGLILPTSVADATRYSEVRAAHNEICEPESDLLQFGEDAFNEVFQPCMALVATCRSELRPGDAGDAWSLAQGDLEQWEQTLLGKLDKLPKLPDALFGERGYRSCTADRGKFAKLPAPQPPLDVPMYEGTSVREFELLPPTAFGDGERLPYVLPSKKWQEVDLFIRQTAKYPIVSPSARVAFRNSVIAAFAKPPHSAEALLAYLNSTPIRWYHFHKQRDAREGMPQVKVGHLRMLPAPDESFLAPLSELGCLIVESGSGITDEQRAELDALAGKALSMEEDILSKVLDWGRANPPPEGRSSQTAGPSIKKAPAHLELAPSSLKAAGGASDD